MTDPEELAGLCAGPLRTQALARFSFQVQVTMRLESIKRPHRSIVKSQVADGAKLKVQRFSYTEATRRVGVLTKKEQAMLILHGKFADLAKDGDCWSVTNFGDFGNGLEGYLDAKTGNLVFLWVRPEG